jgi:hypothetical protein
MSGKTPAEAAAAAAAAAAEPSPSKKRKADDTPDEEKDAKKSKNGRSLAVFGVADPPLTRP